MAANMAVNIRIREIVESSTVWDRMPAFGGAGRLMPAPAITSR